MKYPFRTIQMLASALNITALNTFSASKKLTTKTISTLYQAIIKDLWVIDPDSCEGKWKEIFEFKEKSEVPQDIRRSKKFYFNNTKVVIWTGFIRKNKEQLTAKESSPFSIVTKPVCYCGKVVCIDPIDRQMSSFEECKNDDCKRRFHKSCLNWKQKGGNPFYCPVCYLRTMNPLTSVIYEVIEPTVMLNRKVIQFDCPNQFLHLAKTEKARFEIRCIEMNQEEYYRVKWPDKCTVTLNGKKLIDLVPLEENLSITIRKDRSKGIDKDNIYKFGNRLALECAPKDRRLNSNYAFSLFLVEDREVEDVSSSIMLEYTLDVPSSKEYLKQCFRIMNRASEGKDAEENDDAMKVEKIQVSLIDQFTLQPIKKPARGLFCQHFQAFSLDTFITAMKYNAMKNWKCPICTKPCHIMGYDMYFEKIVNEALKKGGDIQEVKIDENGEVDYGVAPLKPQVPLKNIKERAHKAMELLGSSDEEEQEVEGGDNKSDSNSDESDSSQSKDKMVQETTSNTNNAVPENPKNGNPNSHHITLIDDDEDMGNQENEKITVTQQQVEEQRVANTELSEKNGQNLKPNASQSQEKDISLELSQTTEQSKKKVNSPSKQKPLQVENGKNSQSDDEETKLPETWDEFVDCWKNEKNDKITENMNELLCDLIFGSFDPVSASVNIQEVTKTIEAAKPPSKNAHIQTEEPKMTSVSIATEAPIMTIKTVQTEVKEVKNSQGDKSDDSQGRPPQNKPQQDTSLNMNANEGAHKEENQKAEETQKETSQNNHQNNQNRAEIEERLMAEATFISSQDTQKMDKSEKNQPKDTDSEPQDQNYQLLGKRTISIVSSLGEAENHENPNTEQEALKKGASPSKSLLTPNRHVESQEVNKTKYTELDSYQAIVKWKPQSVPKGMRLKTSDDEQIKHLDQKEKKLYLDGLLKPVPLENFPRQKRDVSPPAREIFKM